MAIDKKRCPACKQYKLLQDFYKCKAESSGYGTYCKKCDSERAKRNWERRYNAYRKIQYPNMEIVPIGWYDIKCEEQGGVCGICGDVDEGKRLNVDHNHNTNKLRGLLCTRCNTRYDWWLKYKKEIKRYAKQYEDC